MLQLVLLVKTTILLENIFKGYLAIHSINSRQDNTNLLPQKEVYFFVKEAFFCVKNVNTIFHQIHYLFFLHLSPVGEFKSTSWSLISATTTFRQHSLNSLLPSICSV